MESESLCELEVKSTERTWENPLQINGAEFVEFAGQGVHELMPKMGFKKLAEHKNLKVSLYRQGQITFLVNDTPDSFASDFTATHGPAACAMGLKVEDKIEAFTQALKNGGVAYADRKDQGVLPAIYGIGSSLVYFIDSKTADIYERDFEWLSEDKTIKGFSLKHIDHMTNNVPVGEMQQWCDFYENIFNFKETRFFNIKGKNTGLISKVMSSPCGKLAIPINEPTDSKSQIQEYLDEYKGSGIQHIALASGDIVETVRNMRAQGVEFLDVPDTYYEDLLERLPNVKEDIEALKELKILVDGDESGYLLQIFTKNMMGPIFIEIIQRKNHWGFGEGNFQALFDAIERDQKERGYL